MATKDYAPTTPNAQPFRNSETISEAPRLNSWVERLEGYIEQRACGRIRDLHVSREGSLVTLEGRSQTYHAKQLAQQAALDLTEDGMRLVNHIVVC